MFLPMLPTILHPPAAVCADQRRREVQPALAGLLRPGVGGPPAGGRLRRRLGHEVAPAPGAHLRRAREELLPRLPERGAEGASGIFILIQAYARYTFVCYCEDFCRSKGPINESIYVLSTCRHVIVCFPLACNYIFLFFFTRRRSRPELRPKVSSKVNKNPVIVEYIWNKKEKGKKNVWTLLSPCFGDNTAALCWNVCVCLEHVLDQCGEASAMDLFWKMCVCVCVCLWVCGYVWVFMCASERGWPYYTDVATLMSLHHSTIVPSIAIKHHSTIVL